MSSTHGSLLAELEAGLRDSGTSLTSLLQKCLLLGGHSRSERLKSWAKQELNGYPDGIDLPKYRYIGAVIKVDAFVGNGQTTGQIIPSWQLPKQARDAGVDETVPVNVGVGELEGLVQRAERSVKLTRFGGGTLPALMNAESKEPFQQIIAVYWDVSVSALHNVLVLVRTAMVELVAELLAALPPGETTPSMQLVDEVVGVVVHSEHAHVTVVQTSSDVGQPVLVSGGAGGTQIGTQTATGENAAAVGSQSTSGDHSLVAGRDAKASAGEPTREGWWRRLRKRGWVVAITTITGGVVGVLTWLDWKPWE